MASSITMKQNDNKTNWQRNNDISNDNETKWQWDNGISIEIKQDDNETMAFPMAMK